MSKTRRLIHTWCDRTCLKEQDRESYLNRSLVSPLLQQLHWLPPHVCMKLHPLTLLSLTLLTSQIALSAPAKIQGFSLNLKPDTLHHPKVFMQQHQTFGTLFFIKYVMLIHFPISKYHSKHTLSILISPPRLFIYISLLKFVFLIFNCL